MKKKLLLIIFMLFLMTGCTVDYQLTIHEDGSVSEDARAMEDAEFFRQYKKSSIGRVVGFLVEPYSEQLNEKEYETNTIINTTNGGIRLNKEFKDISEFSKGTILVSQFADKIEYKEDNSIVSISAKGKLSESEQNQDAFPIDKATIIIELPFKVSNHNADKVSGKKYVWYLKSGEEREIKISYNKDKIAKETNYLIFVVLGIIGAIAVVAGIMLYNVKTKSDEVNKI